MNPEAELVLVLGRTTAQAPARDTGLGSSSGLNSRPTRRRLGQLHRAVHMHVPGYVAAAAQAAPIGRARGSYADAAAPWTSDAGCF
jgi:hypothetical protein